MMTEIERIEGEFLRHIESDPLPLDGLNALLDEAARAGDAARADALAELLQESLEALPRPPEAPLLALLRRRAAYKGGDGGFRDTIRESCRRLKPGDYDLTGYCGFDGGAPLDECLRRLERLLELRPGGFCYNKSWGFGIIRDRNDFLGRFTVDFEGKPGHGIGFAYAAESLSVPAGDHPLVLRHRDPGEHARLLSERPGDLLKNVLRHYGPMNAVVIEETMVRDGLVTGADWKSFWSEARRALKDDPAVALPARKSEPLRFLERPRERFNSEWLASLAALNEPGGIMETIAEREAAGSAPRPDEARVFADRLGHVARVAATPRAAVEAVLAARRLEAMPDGATVAAVWRRLDDRNNLAAVLASMTVRRAREMFAGWFEFDETAALRALPDLAPGIPLRILTSLIAFMAEHGGEKALAERMRPFFQGREPPPVDWLLLLLRDPGLAERMELASRAALPSLALDLIEARGGDSRGNAVLPAEYLSRADRLPAFGDTMTAAQRRDLMRRLQALAGGPMVETARGMMAAWIKAYPDLAEEASAAAAPAGTDQDPFPEARLTSWRSWREKQRQLEKLVNEEIPANAREIAVARSYGDLRENHEYKAAKEHQTILYRRRAELEHDLTVVRGADFAQLPHDRAGLATSVRLRHADGSRETLVILGEWDNEPSLDIISCRSERARCLMGAAPGDTVSLPDAEGAAATATVISVGELPETVRKWLG